MPAVLPAARPGAVPQPAARQQPPGRVRVLTPLAAVTGLAAEARIARRLGVAVAVGGGDERGAEAAAERLARAGAGALLSFGLAGGLDPALRPGDLLLPGRVLADDGEWLADPALLARLGGATPGAQWGGGAVLATAAAKAALHRRGGAVAVDLESAAVARVAARHGLAFAVLRAVCDPAGRGLPGAALAALDPAGRIGPLRVLAAALANPRELPALMALGADAVRARRALLGRVRTLGRIG